MSYKFLSKESMVTVTTTLVDEGHADCRALKRDPLGAALWPFIVRAHQGLLQVQRVGLSPERQQEIRDLQAVNDERHDDLIRCFWFGCLTVEYKLTDSEARARVRRMRDKVLPDGLSSTTKSYRDEVGQAELLRSRLTAEDWAELRAIPVVDGTLADVVQEWLEVAARMGDLEHERSGDREQVKPSAQEVMEARNEWIRAMHALHDAFALRDAFDDDLRAIFDRIERVVEQARRRAGRASSDSEPEADTEAGNGAGDEPDVLADQPAAEPATEVA